MWSRYRRRKHAVVPLLVAIAGFAITRFETGTTASTVGILLAVALGLAYVIEEIVWNFQGVGRPCAACGHRLPMRSFRVWNRCSSCGEPL